MEWNPDVGAYTRWVRVDGVEKLQVRRAGVWVSWTAEERTRPLLDAIAQGWPKTDRRLYNP